MSSSKLEFVDYYDLLRIASNANLQEIRRAYLVQAKQHHPDAGGSTQVMLELNRAYKTLTNESAKVLYDQKHSFHVAGARQNDYTYADGRQIHDVDDMTDSEIDSFLDDLLKEYRDGVPKEKLSTRQRIKRLFWF